MTTDDFLRGVKAVQQELFAEWETSPEKARLSSNFIDAGWKASERFLSIRSERSHLAVDSPNRGRAEGDGS